MVSQSCTIPCILIPDADYAGSWNAFGTTQVCISPSNVFINNGNDHRQCIILPLPDDPGAVNQLRRKVATENPSCYERHFLSFARYAISRINTVNDHLCLHIPKTGGTSLCTLAKKAFGKNQTITKSDNCWEPGHFQPLWISPGLRREKWIGTCNSISSRLPKFVMNENYLDYPLCMQNRLYSILLRDPLERVISHEDHLRRAYEKLKRHHVELLQKNYVTWALTASGAPTHHVEKYLFSPKKEHLEIAKDILSRFDFLLNFSSEHKVCMRAVLDLMGFGGHELTRENKAKSKEAKHNATLDQEKYLNFSLLDINLFQFGQRLMEADCEFYVRLNSEIRNNSSQAM
ncbi:hypothetical protein ACHAWF_015392 [Thalassiosira exigua]